MARLPNGKQHGPPATSVHAASVRASVTVGTVCLSWG
jgi:hypothetical protein